MRPRLLLTRAHPKMHQSSSSTTGARRPALAGPCIRVWVRPGSAKLADPCLTLTLTLKHTHSRITDPERKRLHAELEQAESCELKMVHPEVVFVNPDDRNEPFWWPAVVGAWAT